MPLSPSTASTAPHQSMRADAIGILALRHPAQREHDDDDASGTLMKNTARQLTCSINHPPPTGPSAVVIALNPDHVPIARPRSSPSNVAVMIARLPGTSNAAPMPCSARPTMRTSDVGAKPQTTDAAVNETTPNEKHSPRPSWSPSEPPTRMSAPRKSAYASTTHWTSVIVAFRFAEAPAARR